MFKLIELPYAIDALEPVISARTLEFHHGKHLQGYVDNLNKLIAGTEFEGKSLEEIIKSSKGGVFNNAGQILNHNLYFTQFRPAVPELVAELVEAVEGPTGNLAAKINAQWGSFEAFKAEFEAKGVSLFGSGWVWLQASSEGDLSIGQYANADNPVAHGLKPILTFDVWEHAYYLDYQNWRAAHLNAVWGIVDWEEVEGRYS